MKKIVTIHNARKHLFLLATSFLITTCAMQPSNAIEQEPLILKIVNNSNHSATLSEIEYSYSFKINNKVQKHAIPNSTAIKFSANQAKQIAINVSVPTPHAAKGATINFIPIGITAIKVHNSKNSSKKAAHSIAINPPYYHLNIANTNKQTPAICINYNKQQGWYIEPCKQVKAKKINAKPNKKSAKSISKTTVPAIPKNSNAIKSNAKTIA